MRSQSVRIESSRSQRAKQSCELGIPFEVFREQLKQLTPQQLRALRGDINQKLDHSDASIMTDEEHQMIANLFS
ncbi:hypothetical protein [Vibrio nereis]|uniref:hypothetical protein n=1 Tax=Vibrio nereis TaxID=693 RepID=UPI0024948C2C|nr:hypothetical protein [Vibrio nereis]